ncbi:MAG: DNA translocase FtsK [FCB group bacterium]|jgi:S-DNA-T family DNA segregation ATPase FtsK/SpoIIIE|nr:DNA translocase FtsK [FCB group bacterium]
MSNPATLPRDRRCEIVGVLLLGVAAFLFLSLATDGYAGSIQRPMPSSMKDAQNALGLPGAWVASVLTILFGRAAHLLYFMLGVWGLMLFRHRPLDRLPTRVVGLVLMCCALAGMCHVDFTGESEVLAGGVIGLFTGSLLESAFGRLPANVVGITVALIGLLLATEFLFVRMVNQFRLLAMLLLGGAFVLMQMGYKAWRGEEERKLIPRRRRSRASDPIDEEDEEEVACEAEPEPSEEEWAEEEEYAPTIRTATIEPPYEEEILIDEPEQEFLFEPEPPAEVAAEPVLAQVTELKKAPSAAETKARKSIQLRRKALIDEELPEDYVYPRRYTKPSLDIFDPAPVTERPELGDQLRKTSQLLEETLQTFGIEARVTDVVRGPTITRFELEPAPGIKVSRFLALGDDIALALKAYRVRVEAPIPGKGRVGIEIPNAEREPVVVRELLESRAFRKGKGALPLVLGKDITGDVSMADLASMPHLLVAGATGAGKTVCVKSVLASLLCTKSPEELQMLLIDPKMVELSIFNDIPHLITPVVTDPKKAAASLQWLINEMQERYRLFHDLRVRNIEVYNESVENGEIEMDGADENAPSLDVVRKLPYIVCIIDELADLMIQVRAEVEDAIARLAQLARAVGIHLIIATQRPSVDVLTGVIKANFPARISFQVSSRVDSRCILDEIGAERLIGRGDMLYLPAGHSKPTRIQGAFVSDEEMNALVAYLKTQAPPQYRDEIEKYGKSKDSFDEIGDEDDELFDEAVRVVLETGQASISMVQRRLRVGYTRAARLIDMMELRGIVGPHSGSKAREILVSLPPSDDEVA